MKTKIIFGPPGTGKTTKLLSILEEELGRVKPEEIAFVSFTRKGSYEGKHRTIKKFKISEKRLPYFRTLHSMAFKELNMKRHNMIDKGHYRDFSKSMGMNFVGYYTEELKHNDDAYLFFDILQRNNPKIASGFINTLSMQKLNFIQKNYHKFKQALRIFDFTDLIDLFVQYQIKIPVKVAIVDEAQDLTTLQWKMVLCAFRECDRLYLAGDDDQSIYEWNGADVNFFLNFKGAELEILDKSYRLPDNIVEFASKISKEIKNRVQKAYEGTGRIGVIQVINNLKQLNIDNQKSWLFIGRNNFFLNKYKKFFEEKGVLYTYKGDPSIKESELNAIRNYTSVKKNKVPIPSSLRAHLNHDFNIDKEWYDNFKWTKEKISYYRSIIANKNTDTSNININIETIHSIKGGEADNVVIMEDVTKNVHNNIEINPDMEHRIFYTGVTRTKENLYILQSSTKHYYNLRRLV